jgi:hypothetical protein
MTSAGTTLTRNLFIFIAPPWSSAGEYNITDRLRFNSDSLSFDSLSRLTWAGSGNNHLLSWIAATFSPHTSW